jgi:hypothetical protein
LERSTESSKETTTGEGLVDLSAMSLVPRKGVLTGVSSVQVKAAQKEKV